MVYKNTNNTIPMVKKSFKSGVIARFGMRKIRKLVFPPYVMTKSLRYYFILSYKIIIQF